MSQHLDIDRIAQRLRAERRGKVGAGDGYFGAMQLVADVQARFRVPPGGGRATNPAWTVQRLVRLAPETLGRLEELSRELSGDGATAIEPMQVAAVLLERAVAQMTDHRAK